MWSDRDVRRFRCWTGAALGEEQPANGRVRLLLAAAIFVVALGVRSLYAVDLAPVMYSRSQPGTRMAGRYDEVAVSILRGEGILFPAHPDPADTGRLARPPGYSLFLSALYATLGRSFFAAQLVQNLVGSASAVLLFLLGGRLLGWRVGAVAGLLAALSPHLAYTSNMVLADALCPLPLLLAALLLARVEPKRGDASRLGLATSGLAGVLIGAAAWLRPNVMLLAPFLAVLLALCLAPRRKALARGAVMVLASVAAISPITIRNYVVYREFVPISINGGITLWQGVAAAGGQRYGARTRDKLVIHEEAVYYDDPRYAEWWAAPDGIKRDRDRYRRAMEVIGEHPLWYARAMLARIVEMASFPPGPPLVRAGTGGAETLPPEPDDTEDEAATGGSATGKPDPGHPPLISDDACLSIGRAIGWTRSGTRALQGAADATNLIFMLVGVGVVSLLSWRTASFILMVPFYYFVFESMFILEWRVVVPIHYFLFLLVATAWALAGGAAVGAARRVLRIRSPKKDSDLS